MSKITPRFSARNLNGRLVVADMERDRMTDYLSTLPEQVYIVVKDAKEKRQRSSSQNSYYWGVVVKMFSDETGYTKDESHDFLKRHVMKELGFLEKITVKTTHGDVTEIVAPSTSSFTTEKMEEYLTGCREFCAINISLSIPEPEEVF